MKKAGRPRGTVACDWMGDATGPFCQLRAWVQAIVRMRNAQGTGYSDLSVLRCWKHYLDLENTARESANIEVVEAKIFEP